MSHLFSLFSNKPKVTEDELRTIATKIEKDPDSFTQSGIMLGGEKYICISAEKGLVRGRKNKNALCAVATARCKFVNRVITNHWISRSTGCKTILYE